MHRAYEPQHRKNNSFQGGGAISYAIWTRTRGAVLIDIANVPYRLSNTIAIAQTSDSYDTGTRLNAALFIPTCEKNFLSHGEQGCLAHVHGIAAIWICLQTSNQAVQVNARAALLILVPP